MLQLHWPSFASQGLQMLLTSLMLVSEDCLKMQNIEGQSLWQEGSRLAGPDHYQPQCHGQCNAEHMHCEEYAAGFKCSSLRWRGAKLFMVRCSRGNGSGISDITVERPAYGSTNVRLLLVYADV